MDGSFSIFAARFALPWSAYVRLLSVKRQEARSFYETEALRLGLSVRQLESSPSAYKAGDYAQSQNNSNTGHSFPLVDTAPSAELWVTV
jgi:predicted nuclease of restriction endonuclease-like (RecB) superfamily